MDGSMDGLMDGSMDGPRGGSNGDRLVERLSRPEIASDNPNKLRRVQRMSRKPTKTEHANNKTASLCQFAPFIYGAFFSLNTVVVQHLNKVSPFLGSSGNLR